MINPFVSKEWDLASLELLIDDLVYFEHGHFTNIFLTTMKKELPLAMECANQEYDWESIKPSKQNEKRLDRRRMRKKLDKDFQFDWKDDPGEKATRIFKWWKAMFVVDTDQTQFLCFRLALRLVVLSQMTSCSVERVLFQLELVRDACRDDMLEDMNEIRMLMRCNGDLNV